MASDPHTLEMSCSYPTCTAPAERFTGKTKAAAFLAAEEAGWGIFYSLSDGYSVLCPRCNPPRQEGRHGQ